jgi:3'(2'), 5'-bisphosphate nucleotidase
MAAADGDLLTDALCGLVAEGGRIALKYRPESVDIAWKEDRSPVTAADLAVDAFLVDALARRWPDIPVVTEERIDSQGLAAARFFLVDPIDGTREFVRSRGEFTINVALVENGVPVAGAVCAPAAGRLFAGAAGRGAFEQGFADGRRTPIRPSAPDNDRLAVVASRSHLDAQTEAFVAANRVGRFVQAGSSLKFCMLAAGEADLYPRFGPTMEWDTAAGHAVLLAAGGMVEEISGRPLTYGKAGYRNPGFIAYTPGARFRRTG